MYNPSNSNTRLPILSDVPALTDLKTLLQLAQSYPGEPVEACWFADGFAYTLVAKLPALNPKNLHRKNISASDTEWSLLTRSITSNHSEIAWTHTSADVEFITNLLSVLPGAAPPAGKTTVFGLTKPSLNSQEAQASPQPALQPTSTPAPQSAQDKTQQIVPDAAGGMNLSGDLSEVELTGVLQSIALLRMTGCLEVHAQLDEVTLFFDDGAFVHALYETTLGSGDTPRVAGERVLLELLLWDRGKFFFRPGKKALEKTVTRRLEGLLMEGATLQDYWRYLQKHNVDNECVPTRIRADLSREEFVTIVSQGIPIDLPLQQKVYLEINGLRTLQDVVSKLSMPRLIWVPLIFNLHNSKVITFKDRKRQTADDVALEVPIPNNLILDKVRGSLVRIESGMMSYELFYHFLQLEFERLKRQNNHLISVVVFSIFSARNNEPLSVLTISKLTEYIDRAKDPLDLLAHYRDNDFILMCPYRDLQNTAGLLERITNSLKQVQIEGLQFQDLRLACGLASVPQNCNQLVQLISFAETAKNLALKEKRLLGVCPHRQA